MAKLRKFSGYRKPERPYTRISKFRKKSFIRATGSTKVVRYDTGVKKKYDLTLKLMAKENIQIRDNALESGRLTSTRLLEREIGKTSFHMKINIYPHHILRENPLAAGAGADRMSTGMKRSFGKVIGFAARVKKGQEMVVLSVNKQHINVAKKALKRISYKMPCKCSIQTIQNT